MLLSLAVRRKLGTDFPRSQVLVSDCHFGVSAVNHSVSDSEFEIGKMSEINRAHCLKSCLTV